MRIRLSRALPVAVAVLAAVAAPPVAAATADVREPVPHTAPAADHAPYIVTVREDSDPAEVADRVGATPVHVYRAVLHGFSARLNSEQVEALREMPDVETVEEDGRATGGDGFGPYRWWGSSDV
ncbi:protease inhibitor I9 family protein [Streptomyces sp. NBC_01214]|uniref:protease inhibitor I9 family protein n=1 Tax=Streptomyces sp. NBC_01214 TaxID=2903777 RepID=UPI00225537D7|nr:protease inhibitor I9 family protein [Streptomyces sp. NBC_01214]MCX4800785.1 protease inhibitor I9 family protein [Streptomyces sp. NBC_01214]